MLGLQIHKYLFNSQFGGLTIQTVSRWVIPKSLLSTLMHKVSYWVGGVIAVQEGLSWEAHLSSVWSLILQLACPEFSNIAEHPFKKA